MVYRLQSTPKKIKLHNFDHFSAGKEKQNIDNLLIQNYKEDESLSLATRNFVHLDSQGLVLLDQKKTKGWC